jgi:glyoxylase I family protein
MHGLLDNTAWRVPFALSFWIVLQRPQMASFEPAPLNRQRLTLFNIVGLDHLVLRVRALDTMLAFYCGALGCTVERRQDSIGLVQLRAGVALIDLVPVDGPLGRAGGAAPGLEARNLDHFCLRIEPFDEQQIRQQLTAHGVQAGPVESRYGAEGEGPSIYLNDPEGNVVELKGPPLRTQPLLT